MRALYLPLLSLVGTLCKLLAAGCVILASRSAQLGGNNWSEKLSFMCGTLFLGYAFFWAGIQLSRFVRRSRIPTAEQVLTIDQRAPVLYLHAFKTDREYDLEHARNDDPRKISPGYTVEEEVAFVFNFVGPFVAIANPRDPVRQGGAFRTYQSDDAWRAYVLETMQRAQMVVVRVYPTEHLGWEIRQACRLLRPEKLLLLILAPPGKTDPYTKFLHETCGLNIVLPEQKKSRNLLGKLRGILFEDEPSGFIITFRTDFEPVVRPIRPILKPRFAQRYLHPGNMPLAYFIFSNIEDHLEQYALLSIPPPPYRRTLVDYVVTALLIMTVGAIIVVVVLECLA